MFNHYSSSDGSKVILMVHGIGGGEESWFNFLNYFRVNFRNNPYSTINFTYYKISYLKPTSSRLVNLFIFFLNKILFFLKVFWSKRNDYNATLLKEYIDKNCSEAKVIVLVAHSMGGLICRKLLVDLAENNESISKFRMLVTYATPHKGSHMAKFVTLKRVGGLNWCYRKITGWVDYRLSPQLGDLDFHKNDFISNLTSKWSKYNIEKDLTFVKIVATKDRWVNTQSASSPMNNLAKIFEFEGSHNSIINPKTNQDFLPIDCFISELKGLEKVLSIEELETNEVLMEDQYGDEYDENSEDESY